MTMGLFDALVPALVARFQIPPSAAKGAIACVVKAHAGDPVSQQHIKNAVNGPSALLPAVLSATYAALKSHPAFWTAHYAAQARAVPLHPSHPYAAHIAANLARIGTTTVSGHGHHGGGGGGHGGGHHRAHGFGRRGGGSVVAVVDADPYYSGPDYILSDEALLDAVESPGIYGGPETAPDWQKGGN
jgi:hypothetical protein